MSHKNVKIVDQNVSEILDTELEDDIGLKDYQIDRIKLESNELFKHADWKNSFQFAQRNTNRWVIFWSLFIPLLAIGFVYFILVQQLAFVYLYIVMQVFILYWYFVLAPLRTHTFTTDEQFVRYRVFLEHGPNIKAYLREYKWKIAVFYFIFLDIIVFLCIHHTFVDPYMITYLNNVIYDRGAYPYSLVTSLVPALIFIGIGVTIFGAILVGRYRKINASNKKESIDPIMQKVLIGLVIASVFGYFLIGALNSAEFTKFWSLSNDRNNWVWLFDDEDPLYHARATIILYYLAVYLGCSALIFLILIGFTAFQFGLLRIPLVDRNHNQMIPPEDNWEYKPVLEHQELVVKEINQGRKHAAIEIGVACVIAILGMWLFLFYMGEVVDNEVVNDIGNVLGYAVLGLLGLWAFFFNQVYHVKHEKHCYYPTAKMNVHYVAWDERGLGSWKYYYREVWGKKKGLIAWIVMWCLECLVLYLVDWERIWEGRSAEGTLLDLTENIFDPNYVTAGIVVWMSIMVVIGFLCALGMTKESFGNSIFWCTLYKFIMAAMVLAHLRWFTLMPQVVSKVNIISLDFAWVLLAEAAALAIVSVIGALLILPFIVKFDNLAAPAEAILNLIFSTIVLMVLMVFIFHALLPQTDINGVLINWPYPFENGLNREAKALWNDFTIRELLLGWGNRYVWWGALQQYLFMSYFLVLWKKVFPKSKGYVVSMGTACIFGVIHAIDWMLMLSTALMGMLWAYYWQKEYFDKTTGKVVHGNNLLLWGFVHGFGGTFLGMMLPFTMGVGPFNM